MIEKFMIEIAEKIKNPAPSLFVISLRVDNVKVRKSEQDDLEEQKKQIVKEWDGTTPSDLDNNMYIKTYRDLSQRLGADPGKMLPAVEAMLTRGILKGIFPRINSVVDTANIMSLRKLLPIGVFDEEKITGQVVLDLSSGEEKFLPIGSKKEVKLPPRVPLLVDEQGIFSAVGHRDSQRTMITKKTNSIMVFSWGIDPVEKSYVNNALQELAHLLSNCPGEDQQ